MPCVSLQRKDLKFQEEPSDLETLLLEFGFLCENATEGDTLDSPTEEFIYDFDCFEASGTPIHVRTRRREVHGSAACRWLESVEYSDGAGRVVLAKAVAEPGRYRAVENGAVVEKDSGADVRWVGSGRTVYNNAGNPVKQYEPYFSGTDDYESEPAIVETGVTPVLHYDPLDRLVRTDLPDGTFSRVEFATWEQKSFDQDDTVLESSWYADRGSPDPAGNEPANPEKRAAWLSAKHAGTPSVEYLDAQGRPFYGVADNGTLGRYATLTVFDVLGNPLSVKDAKGRVVMAYAYNSLSAACRTESMDAGERRTLPAVDGLPVLGFDARNHRLRSVYDALRRPTEQWLSGNGGAEKLVGRTVYGESAANPEVSNLRGMAWKSYDQGGLVENAAYDFKGNLLESARRFTKAYNQTIDWNVADPDALLEPETFTTVTAYDALNRATSIRTPHNSSIPASEILPAYNEANLLESVNVKLRGAATATNFVQNIDYDAKGRRERIQYGNGSTTGYAYDEKTFRLKRLLTTRNNGADVLQDLNYTYDAVGNVTQIDDSAQQTIFFNGNVVSPSQKFEYDALYRLIKATGREHASVNADGEPEAEGYNAAQISPQDGTAMRNYAREWEYDSVGNILSIIHQANGNAWTRTNAYAADSNRLIGTTVGQTTASFAYNAHGSMTSMPHLSAMDWDFAEKLCHITRGTTEAYYNYDGSGIRTRKVVEKNGTVETRLYLGGFEIWRKTVNGTLETECETLHVMDDQKRIAIVETLAVENGNKVANPAPVLRYQLDNHLGSASLELDGSANIISYEEYYPYGDTSYRAGRNASEVSRKRYRYTGKEKDEESSLYYCEQRYYAAHISRWVSTDPTWLEDGINLYAYVHGNPVSGVDPSGTQTVENDEVKPIIYGENFLCGFSKINQDGEKEEFSELKVLENESKKTDYKTTTDAGHGDRLYKHKTFDPGALSGTDKGNEKDFALKVEAQVDFWLQEFGIQNQRTRTGDVELGENEKKLHWRVDKAKEFGSSVLVSIHLDSGNKPGLFSIYKTEEGKKLGEYIAQNIKTLPLKGDGLRKDIRNLFLLRKFDKGAAVIIELGGIKNEKTQTDINISSFYIGKEIATGIYQYLYNGKTPSPQKIGFCKW